MRRLLIRPGAIGDFIVSLPALEFLRTNHTEVWTSSSNVPLVRFADHAESIADGGLDSLGIAGFKPSPRILPRLAAFDSIVSWYGAARPEFREAVAGLPFEFHSALPGESLHSVDFYLRQVGAPFGQAPALPITRREEDFAVIHPFSGGRKKNWPLHRFQEVAARIPIPVYWTAGPEEELATAKRYESLWDLAVWLSRARLFLGNDSGISHLAAAAGTPVIALFGPTSAQVWSPRGSQVSVIQADDGSMDSISVPSVLKAVERCLSP